MKKLVASLLIVAAMGVLTACTNFGSGSTTENYEVEFGTFSDCLFDETVTLPEIFITLDGEVVDKEYSVSVVDPNGAEVTVENGSFTANVVGEYTITVTMGNVTETLTFECKKPQKSAVTDLSVSTEGELTFSAVDGETYTLYVGSQSSGAITSGTNITDKLNEGVNSVYVVTDGSDSYLASEKSNVVQIEKVATVKDFSVNENFVLSFTEEDGVIYDFYINGATEAISFNSGDSILNYLEMGENTVYIVAKKNGAITSGASEIFKVSLNNYIPLDDVAVIDGIVTFTEEEGLTYRLYVNEEDRGLVTSGANLDDYMKEYEELTTVDIQVQIEADDNYGASILSNAVKYFYNKGFLGSIVYDGSSRIMDTFGKITDIMQLEEDGMKFMRFQGDTVDTANSQIFASVLFDTPLAVTVDATKVNYMRLKVRAAETGNGVYALTRGSLAAYGYSSTTVHMYDSNYCGKWCTVEIQIPADVTEVKGFYVEIMQAVNYETTYIDVASAEIVSYDKEIETSLGVWNTASINGYGKDTTKWSVPYNVEEVTETVSVGDVSYDKYVKLSKDTDVTFGGNTPFAVYGTTVAGALLNYDFSAYKSNNVIVTVTLKADRDIIIEGLANKALAKTNVVAVNGEWQTVEVTMKNSNLQGIVFLSINNQTNYSEVPDICIADISVAEVPAPPIAKDVAVSVEGVITFTAEEGYTYNLLDGEGSVLKENVYSGDTTEIKDGLNEFVIQTLSAEGETSECDIIVIFKSEIGYGINSNIKSNSNEITYTEERIEGVTALKVQGKPENGVSVGGSIILKQPIATDTSKINYAVVTYKTPDAWRSMNRISFGANGDSNLIVHSYDNGGLPDSWIQAYIQLSAGTTSLDSIYFDIAQSNSYRETWVYITDIKVESFDKTIETSLGNWTVASIGGAYFGKNSANWSVPYTVTESEESVSYGDTTYNKVVKLTDETYSFGGNTPWSNAGTYHTGALLDYKYTGEATYAEITLLVKISKGSKIAIAVYGGTTVDKTNVIEGTGEWQEVSFSAPVNTIKGFTFVAINDGVNYVSPSTVEIAAITTKDLQISGVTDLAISADGTVTFTEEDGHTYDLYNGDELVYENIVSGEKITINDGNNVYSLKVTYVGMETDSNAVEIFGSSVGYGVKTLNPKSGSNAITYSVETVDGKTALKTVGTPTSASSVGGSIILKQPIATDTSKINYAVITYKTPDAWRSMNRISFGANGDLNLIVHSYDNGGLPDSWIQAYIQLSAGTTSLDSIYFDIAQSNSYRETWVYITDIKVESFDKTIETSLGNWTVASIGGAYFGKNSANWSVPYTITESEESVSYGDATYNKVVKLTDETYSFGGNTPWSNAGTYHTGALLNYTCVSANNQFDAKLLVKISAGSKIAIAVYGGTTVDKTNVILGTGEWQEVTLRVNVSTFKGFTFVAVNDGTNYVSASTVEIAAITESELEISSVNDLEISADGTVTFTEAEGHTYSLYNGDEVVYENIVSGEKITINDGNNVYTLKIEYLSMEASSNAVEIFGSSVGYGVKTLNPKSGSNEITYSVETVDGKTALKTVGTPTSATSVGGSIILKQPIATDTSKVNYAVVTYRTPDSWRAMNIIAFGVNNNVAAIVYSYYNGGLPDSWIQAYIQLPAGTSSLDSVYFDIIQSNSYRNTWIWISDITVEAYDTVKTDLGDWTVASIGGAYFGKNSANWSVPYTVTESEETVEFGDATYNKVVKLTDETYSFGGNTPFAANGTYHTGALLNYTTDSTETTVTLKLGVKISAGSKIAIAGYNGNVDKNNVITGTGEWQEIEITVTVADLQGITFVAINDGSNYVSPSSIEIIYIK